MEYQPCKHCNDIGEFAIDPAAGGWRHVRDRIWITERGEQFEFTPEMRGVLLVKCTACVALAA